MRRLAAGTLRRKTGKPKSGEFQKTWAGGKWFSSLRDETKISESRARLFERSARIVREAHRDVKKPSKTTKPARMRRLRNANVVGLDFHSAQMNPDAEFREHGRFRRECAISRFGVGRIRHIHVIGMVTSHELVA